MIVDIQGVGDLWTDPQVCVCVRESDKATTCLCVYLSVWVFECVGIRVRERVCERE